MTFKVLLTDYEFENLIYEEKVLKESGLDIQFLKAQCWTEEEVIAHAKDADAIINQYAPISRQVIESLEKCQVISKYGVGVNNIDIAAAAEKGIVVANVPDYGMEEVSNHALALLLAWTRKIPLLNEEVKRGKWDFKSSVPIHRFDQQTIGVLGFGRIPRRFVEKVKPLGAKIAVYDPFVSAADMAKAGAEKMELDELIRVADFLSIHVPLNEQTHHLINEERLKQMKPTAVIINTARGPVVKEAALIEALANGTIAGAALDVTEFEPVSPDNPLLKMDNVILTPHSAWYSEEAMVEVREKAALNIVQVLSGRQSPYAL
ncbi:C-terminal binding protein [Bacillus aerolatus]|uniref:C-terminal binding protein n=1 Tax=Bacillus aerolatus TaxID=2653354 RepID=A0A6I1FG87_9BACI|nr:C-terminal binding protein [Bacillus aerolatus]KAB7707185.1 C-terminal binding protein [Bacillus aerolatus]